MREYNTEKELPDKPKKVSQAFIQKFRRKRAQIGAGGMSELIHKEKLQPIKKANLLEAQDHAIYEEVNYMKDRAARLKGSDPDYGESVINLAAAAIYSDGNSVELENSCQLLSSFQAIKPVKLAYRRKFLPSQAKEVLLQEERYTKKFPVGVQMADVDGEI